MTNLIRQLYCACQSEGDDLAAQCETVAFLFAEHLAPHSKSTYPFLLQHNFPVIVKNMYTCGLGMFCQNICQTWDCILQRFYNHHTNS